MINQLKKIVAILIILLFFSNTSIIITSANSNGNSCYLVEGSVDPYTGYNGDWFTFGVKYFDTDGSNPVISRLSLRRPNGVWVDFKMQYLSGSCKKNGAIYYFSGILREEGEFGYKFYFKNSNNEECTLPENPDKYFVGPIVLNKNVVENFAMFICGGGDDNFENACEKTSTYAHGVFESIGYDKDHIIYLSSDLNDNGVDDLSTKSNVEKYMQDLSLKTTRKSKIFLFICGHGNQASGCIKITNSLIYDYELSDLIDTLNYKTITVLIDSCYAGNFIDDISGKNRIIVCSTNKEKKAYSHTEYGLFFSTPFFKALGADWSYGEAWEYADRTIVDSLDINDPNVFALKNMQKSKDSSSVYINTNDDQIPLIDDNGDKQGHGTSDKDTLPLSGDGNLALNTYPGYQHDNSRSIFNKRILEKINLLLNRIIEKLELLRFYSIFT
jgi:hypothetical protein